MYAVCGLLVGEEGVLSCCVHPAMESVVAVIIVRLFMVVGVFD